MLGPVLIVNEMIPGTRTLVTLRLQMNAGCDESSQLKYFMKLKL